MIDGFKVGDRVTATEKGEWYNGLTGTVTTLDHPSKGSLSVAFDGGTKGHSGPFPYGCGRKDCWNFGGTSKGLWSLRNLKLVAPAKPTRSIAKDLRLTPQARTVLKHLEHRGRISPSEALITYSISRLASCIHEVRRAGYNVLCIIKKDEHGHKYARYTLIKPSMVN